MRKDKKPLPSRLRNRKNLYLISTGQRPRRVRVVCRRYRCRGGGRRPRGNRGPATRSHHLLRLFRHKSLLRARRYACTCTLVKSHTHADEHADTNARTHAYTDEHGLREQEVRRPTRTRTRTHTSHGRRTHALARGAPAVHSRQTASARRRARARLFARSSRSPWPVPPPSLPAGRTAVSCHRHRCGGGGDVSRRIHFRKRTVFVYVIWC